MRGTPINLSPIKRSVARCHEVMNIWRYEEWAGNLLMLRATGTVPERVQSRVHTTEPTGPVPESFHCDHIARWSARSGTTGRSGIGVNTGARLRSGTVPVPKLWCEHGLIKTKVIEMLSSVDQPWQVSRNFRESPEMVHDLWTGLTAMLQNLMELREFD